jgi:hypothetical protein
MFRERWKSCHVLRMRMFRERRMRRYRGSSKRRFRGSSMRRYRGLRMRTMRHGYRCLLWYRGWYVHWCCRRYGPYGWRRCLCRVWRCRRLFCRREWFLLLPYVP